jgi:hypothetical protein
MAEDWLSRARGLSPGEAIEQGISGIILAIAGGIIGLVSTFTDSLGRLFGILDAAREFAVSLITNPTTILEISALDTAGWIASTNLGPLGFAVGVAAIAAAFWVWDAADVSVPFLDRILPWRGD